MTIRTAVVLAAGEGTRLRPMTRNRPKPMLPAANRPILEHVLEELVKSGMERLVIVVGYRRDRVQEYFGPSYLDVPIEYVIQEKQLGSGHALLQARDEVDEPHLVVNGDRLIEAESITRVVKTFQNEDAPAALAVIERPSVRQYGAVVLRDHTITEIIEKPQTDEYRLINAGIYAFDTRIFEAIEATDRDAGELALTETIASLIEESRVRGVRTEGMWVDATYPWDLLEVCGEVLARGRVSQPERESHVWVDSDASVHDAATLRPPVVIGPDAEIGPGSVVGPRTAIGRNGTVGSNTVVERSLFDADTRVSPGSTIIDTVLGQDVHIGPSTSIPGGSADVRVGTDVFEDQQLGAVIADRSRFRGSVSVEPGSLVGPMVTVHDGAHIRGSIKGGAEVVR